MPQQTATRSTGSMSPAGQYQSRRSPQRLDGSRGSGRSAQTLEEIWLGRKVLRDAGVHQPEVFARRLVELRDLGDADYAPASVVWQGSVAAARDQLAEHDAALTTALEGSNTRPAPVYQVRPEPDLGYAAPSPAM